MSCVPTAREAIVQNWTEQNVSSVAVWRQAITRMASGLSIYAPAKGPSLTDTASGVT